RSVWDVIHGLEQGGSVMAVSETMADEQQAVAQRPRGRVRVYGKWCKGCGLCVAFCPRQVFEMDADHHPRVAHPERCIACQWCEVHCPDFAIRVERINADDAEVSK
ncbi:MAG: 4Fe-4S binding protein, partial [Chloroflexota bacterium]